ncbi:MAG: CpsD/CapB family tyrosine-protein kinase [Candidatus Zixiibacteriota bacterium]
MTHNEISIIDYFSLETAFAAEFRRLLYNLQESEKDGEMKAVMVTSSMLSEGKSTITSLLAITAAKKGLKTVIIDSDLRRPVIHQLFKLERQLGLHEILADEAAAKSVIKKTSLDNLDVITAGKISAHPAEVFNGPAIGRLIEEMKFYYDQIIIDSAPIIPVSDPLFVANEVDGVVLVIKAGETQREVVKRAVDILKTNHFKLLGVVLNNMSGSLPYYYDYSYYGYHYEQKPPGLSGKDDRMKSPHGNSTPDKKKRNDPTQDKISPKPE